MGFKNVVRSAIVFYIILLTSIVYATPNGSIVAWGSNIYGQSIVPEPNMDFKAIAANGFHSLGLKGCQYNLAGDLNGDCKVDMLDFAVTANNWLLDCYATPSNPACVPK